jgi:hypothetical protein
MRMTAAPHRLASILPSRRVSVAPTKDTRHEHGWRLLGPIRRPNDRHQPGIAGGPLPPKRTLQAYRQGSVGTQPYEIRGDATRLPAPKIGAVEDAQRATSLSRKHVAAEMERYLDRLRDREPPS